MVVIFQVLLDELLFQSLLQCLWLAATIAAAVLQVPAPSLVAEAICQGELLPTGQKGLGYALNVTLCHKGHLNIYIWSECHG